MAEVARLLGKSDDFKLHFALYKLGEASVPILPTSPYFWGKYNPELDYGDKVRVNVNPVDMPEEVVIKALPYYIKLVVQEPCAGRNIRRFPGIVKIYVERKTVEDYRGALKEEEINEIKKLGYDVVFK